jgi:autotransporter-associated beta strand protein
VSGGLEKRGSGTLVVDKVCTYTGLTRVSGGTLKLGVNGAINASGGVVLAGGTLDVNAKEFNVPVVGGEGSVVGVDTLTLSEAISFDAQRLIAGGALSFAGSIVIPAGASIGIDNHDIFEQAKKGRIKLIAANGGFSGNLPVLAADLSAKGWWLELSADGKDLYICRSSGLWLICR